MLRIEPVLLANDTFREGDKRRTLRIAAVQLENPLLIGLTPSNDSGRLEWDVRSKERTRSALAIGVIKELFAGSADTFPDIVVLPELSVPELAHTEFDFQELANHTRSILVPGSFIPYESGTDLDRIHVSNIYVPGEEAPRIIAKANPTPGESRFVAAHPTLPNVVQFRWKPDDAPSAAAINLFLCRDFLRPMVAGDMPQTPDLWSYEGINIVMMLNREARLFEGQAAIEIRRLRGPGRASIFVNSANVCEQLGTAIIAPAPAVERERDDVAKSVAWDKPGILTTEITPWDIEYRETRPDKTIYTPLSKAKVSYPISLAEVSYIGSETSSATVLLEPEERPIRFRAVWKPALLEVLKRVLSIELYTVKSESKSRELARTDIENAYVGFIRGTDDIIIRRYPNKDTGQSLGTFPDIVHLHSGVSGDELFSVVNPSPKLKVIVYPKDIYKYRGQNCLEGFDQHREQIRNTLPGPRPSKFIELGQILHRISRLAREVGEDAVYSSGMESAIPSDLRSFFFQRLEENFQTGHKFGNGRRETYAFLKLPFIDDEHLFKAFMDEIVATYLMPLDEVREIFKLSGDEQDTHGFNFMIKIKADAFRTDDIVRFIRNWGEGYDKAILSRTSDVMETIKEKSIFGISSYDVSENMAKFRALVGEMSRSAIRLLIAWEADSKLNAPEKIERFLEISEDWSLAALSLDTYEIPRDATQKFESLNDALFSNLFISFCSEGDREGDEALKRIRDALTEAHGLLEELASKVVCASLNCTKESWKDSLISQQPDVGSHRQWNGLHSNEILRGVITFFSSFPFRKAEALMTKEEKRDFGKAFEFNQKLRNDATHRDNWPIFHRKISMSADEWKDNLHSLRIYMTNCVFIYGRLSKAL